MVFYFLLLFAVRPTSRRKVEPLPDSDEAQKKYGSDVKAISSDMYFGKQDNSEVSHSLYFTSFVNIILTWCFFLYLDLKFKINVSNNDSNKYEMCAKRVDT